MLNFMVLYYEFSGKDVSKFAILLSMLGWPSRTANALRPPAYEQTASILLVKFQIAVRCLSEEHRFNHLHFM